MATLITKNSSTASSVPTAAQLVQGELAVNVTDKRLFTENSSGTVVELGTNPSTLALPNGTANGVAYLNGSKVLTTGSALTFDGSNLLIGATTAGGRLSVRSTGAQMDVSTSATDVTFEAIDRAATGNSIATRWYTRNGDYIWNNGSYSEAMRLTTTGLGIGTSSWSTAKLYVLGNTTNYGITSEAPSGYAGLNLKQTSGNTMSLGMASNGLFIYDNNAGTTRLTLDSSGNLGLGVTPSAWTFSGSSAMQIRNAGFAGWADNAYVTANAYLNSSGGFSYIAANFSTQYRQAGGQHIWYTAPSGTAGNAISFTQAMTLDASGNLGIGATSSLKKLTVQGSTADRTVEVIDNGSNDAAIMLQLSGVQEFTLGVDRTDNSFRIADSGALGTNDRLVIDSSGNLGVGTSSPSFVSGGGIAIYRVGDARITLKNNATGDGSTTGAGLVYSGVDLTVNNQEAGYIRFTTTGTERARITSGGDLLVGTTSGSFHRFHKSIAGDFAVQSANTSATTPYVHVLTFTAAAPNDATSMFLRCDDTGVTGRIQLRSNGGIANYSANNVNLSDRREKTNFAPAGEYLSKICAIPVQTFNYIDQSENDPGLTLGVVAQDVQAVAPELVMESNWGTEDNPKMRLSIYQTDLQYALMKALQELKAEFDAYKATHP